MAISDLPSPSTSAVALLTMRGVWSGAVTTRFFHDGFSYQAQVPPPTATTSGRPSPSTSATSTWSAPGNSPSTTTRSNPGADAVAGGDTASIDAATRETI